MEDAYKSILDEILDDAISSLCFSVHRAVKLNYFSLDEYVLRDNKFEVSTCSEEEVSSHPLKKSYQVTCPCCFQKKVDVNNFMRHLNSCMKNIRRQSGRNASKRINMDANRLDDFFDDYDNFSDGSSSSKRTRKKVGKNSRAAKLKAKTVEVAESSTPDIQILENFDKASQKLENATAPKRTKKVCPLKFVQQIEDKVPINFLQTPGESEDVDVVALPTTPVWDSRSPSPSPLLSTPQAPRTDGNHFPNIQL